MCEDCGVHYVKQIRAVPGRSRRAPAFGLKTSVAPEQRQRLFDGLENRDGPYLSLRLLHRHNL